MQPCQFAVTGTAHTVAGSPCAHPHRQYQRGIEPVAQRGSRPVVGATAGHGHPPPAQRRQQHKHDDQLGQAGTQHDGQQQAQHQASTTTVPPRLPQGQRANAPTEQEQRDTQRHADQHHARGNVTESGEHEQTQAGIQAPGHCVQPPETAYRRYCVLHACSVMRGRQPAPRHFLHQGASTRNSRTCARTHCGSSHVRKW